jgi:hypothetical protein
MGGEESFDAVRFGEALEIYRSATSSLFTGLTALTLALVTLIGFSITNQSWGIALTSGLLEPFMLLVIDAYARRVKRVLRVAGEIEANLTGSSKLTDAIVSGAAGTPDPTVEVSGGRFQRPLTALLRRRQTAFITAVGLVHMSVVAYLVFVQHWTFTGSS